MKKEEKEVKENNSKFNIALSKLKEMWKDKRGRAKIKLALYFAFFIGVLIFARIIGSINNNTSKENITNDTFLNQITDNYEYQLNIILDDNTYNYEGKVLGYNASITRNDNNNLQKYRVIDNKYYVKDGDNLLLTDENEVYPVINKRYLDLNNIKGYFKISEPIENEYRVKLSRLILYGSEDKYITIKIDEKNMLLTIDYTELFKENGDKFNQVIVSYTFKNIGKITSLEDDNDNAVEDESSQDTTLENQDNKNSNDQSNINKQDNILDNSNSFDEEVS